MLVDLTIALLAALVVVVAPGWFWAAAFFGDGGRFERVIYSMGFSFVLTSVLAYVPARISGAGVTLPVAVASPVAVFVAGFALYKVIGRHDASSKKRAPLVSEPAKLPGSFVIAPLLPSAVIALGWSFDYLSGVFWLISSGGLAVLGGLIYVFSSSPERAESPTTEEGFFHTLSWLEGEWVRRIVTVAVFILVLVRGYIGPVLQDWPFVQGVDHYSHAVMANLIVSRGEIFPYLIYPPGFHTMTALISQVSGLRPLEVFTVLAPALFLLPSLAVYALGSRLWGWQYGALAALLVGVVANGPYIFYNDAMYPNLATSEFLMVLAISALVAFYASPSWRSGFAFVSFGAAPVFFHQVGSFYMAAFLALVALYILPYLMFRDHRRGIALFYALAATAALALVYAWDTYNLTQVIADYFGSGPDSETGTAVNGAIGTQVPYPPREFFGIVLTTPVAWLGLIGAFFLLSGKLSINDEVNESYSASKATILLWTLVMCAGATTSLSGFPQRFAQDLCLPLSLLAALAAITLSRSIVTGRRSRLAGYVATIAPVSALAVLLVTGGLSTYWISRNLEPDGGPGVSLSYAKKLTITPEIAEAGEWLRRHNDGGNIIVSPQANQVPSRMMLAMGEYPGYQSFTIFQLHSQRDLPPGGAPPLWQVLQVVNFPDSARAREIIRDRDVRYIVHYKSMPDRGNVPYYTRFEAAPDLYETTFENSDVVIFRLRDARDTGEG